MIPNERELYAIELARLKAKIKELEAKEIVFPTDTNIKNESLIWQTENKLIDTAKIAFERGANWAIEFIQQKNK